MKVVGVLGTALFLTAAPANAAVVQLAGTTPGNATVFKIDLQSTGLASIAGLQLVDGADLAANGTNPLFSGLDLDAVWISGVDCGDLSCVAGASSAAGFDYANAAFTHGSIMSGGTSLFGVVGGGVDHAVATLGVLDAQFSPGIGGFFSLGLGGALSLSLLSPLDLGTGNYYLYIAEVGGAGAEFNAARLSFSPAHSLKLAEAPIETPLPAAFPLLVTGIIGLFGLGRRTSVRGRLSFASANSEGAGEGRAAG